MRRIPTAIMMSGTGSNAVKIIEEKSPNLDIRVILTDNPWSNAERIAKENGLEYELNSIYGLCEVENEPGRLTGEDRKKLLNKDRRKIFDLDTTTILKKYGIELIAAAGYDWVMSHILPANYVIVNVHPGDLRVRDAVGKPSYSGLAWIPTAKAILNGEKYAHTSTHLITPGLDEGPIARVSSPVLINLPEGVTKENILQQGITLKDVIRDINYGGGEQFGNSIIYRHSKLVQNKLKERGDWVEFPLTMHLVAEYIMDDRFNRDFCGNLQLDERPIPHEFLRGY